MNPLKDILGMRDPPFRTYPTMGPSSVGSSEEEIANRTRYGGKKHRRNRDLYLPDLQAPIGVAGSAFHGMAGAIMLDEGAATSVENRIFGLGGGIRGYSDYHVASQNLIGDIKSVSVRQMENIVARQSPRMKDVHQVNMYLGMTGQEQGQIRYYLQDNPAVQQTYNFDFDPSMYRKDIHKIREGRHQGGMPYGASRTPIVGAGTTPKETPDTSTTGIHNYAIEYSMAMDRLHRDQIVNQGYLRRRYNQAKAMTWGMTDFGSPWRGPKVSGKIGRAMASPSRKVTQRHDMRTAGLGLELWDNRTSRSRPISLASTSNGFLM